MFAVTDRAAFALAERLSEKGLPSTSGHRITRAPADNGAGASYKLQVATAPALQDEVLKCGVTQIFVAVDAVDALGDVVLDVDDKDTGRALVLRRGS